MQDIQKKEQARIKYRVKKNTKKIPPGAWIFVFSFLYSKDKKQNGGHSRRRNKYR